MYEGLTVLRVFFVQAEDGIRDLVRSRGLGDVYKRQGWPHRRGYQAEITARQIHECGWPNAGRESDRGRSCLLYTSDAADERSSVDLGGRRII